MSWADDLVEEVLRTSARWTARAVAYQEYQAELAASARDLTRIGNDIERMKARCSWAKRRLTRMKAGPKRQAIAHEIADIDREIAGQEVRLQSSWRRHHELGRKVASLLEDW